MPHTLRVLCEQFSPIRSDDGLADEIETLLNQGGDEPIGHILFREAWTHRLLDRRSSLLMCIAAAEIGFKACAIDLVPDTRWLVENMPSPPLVPMLKEYLPTLPTRNTIAGKVVPPPEEILKSLEKGVSHRNHITHKTSANEPKYETLEEVLSAVRDVLWLLDYYRGFSWALANVRPEVRSKMENPVTPAQSHPKKGGNPT